MSSEVTKAPRTSAQCKFYHPTGDARERYGYWQLKLNELFGRPLKPRADGLGGLLGFEQYDEKVMENLVTTVGKNDLLDKYFAGSAYTATWFAGIVSSVSFSAYAAADTMASHAGWTEAGATNAPNYTGNRPAITFGAAAAGVKASSSIPSVTFSAGGTVKGLFCTSITTKDGTTGILYSAGNFTSGDAVVSNGFVMTMTFSVTQT